ncbi:MAG: hypothetical protein KAI17_12820 [Thiotrichaceae bacterium]|nr:hypothetical protein [Thiotrichaceae bacterium]
MMSKFGLIIGIVLGIGSLISCGAIKESSVSNLEDTVPGLECISDGANFESDSSEAVSEEKIRLYSESVEKVDTPDCIMPELAN